MKYGTELKIVEEIANQASKDLVEVIKKLNRPMVEMQKTILKNTESFRVLEKFVGRHQEQYIQIAKIIGEINLPKKITDDFLNTYNAEELEISEDKRYQLAENLGFECLESMEQLIEEEIQPQKTTQLVLTSDGKFLQLSLC